MAAGPLTGADRRAVEREVGEELAGWGKVALIETRGRLSGKTARAAVGFAEEPDGSLVVAAGDPEPHWAANLFADPSCVVSVADRRWPAIAEPLEGADRGVALRELILKYGTPAERLGLGAMFRLRPAPGGPG